jgi:hypothetical protein
LLFSRSPSAVSGFIVAVIVNAVKRMLRRRFNPHVFKEVFEGLQPAGTDCDPSPDVCFAFLYSIRITPGTQLYPSPIFRTDPAPAGMPMLFRVPITATTFCGSSRDVCSFAYDLITTSTPDKPQTTSKVAQYCQLPKPVACMVFLCDLQVTERLLTHSIVTPKRRGSS